MLATIKRVTRQPFDIIPFGTNVYNSEKLVFMREDDIVFVVEQLLQHQSLVFCNNEMIKINDRFLDKH